MMGNCCAWSRAKAARPQSNEIDGRVGPCLDRILDIYPGQATVALLSPAFDVMVHRCRERNEPTPTAATPPPPSLFTDDALAAIGSLKKVAVQMASTLREVDCPVIHVSGETHHFSCYEVGENLLAVYSDLRALDIDRVDVPATDTRILDLIGDIKAILSPPPHP